MTYISINNPAERPFVFSEQTRTLLANVDPEAFNVLNSSLKIKAESLEKCSQNCDRAKESKMINRLWVMLSPCLNIERVLGRIASAIKGIFYHPIVCEDKDLEMSNLSNLSVKKPVDNWAVNLRSLEEGLSKESVKLKKDCPNEDDIRIKENRVAFLELQEAKLFREYNAQIEV